MADIDSRPEGFQRVRAALAQRAHPHEPLWLNVAARTAQEAADALGVTLGQIAKSVVFRRKADDTAVLVITSGDKRVDEAKLKPHTGPLGRADADYVKARTGFSIGGVSPLGADETAMLLKSLKGWTLADGKIGKTFEFGNYHETMAFVNAVAWIAHVEDHHPDMTVTYNRCDIAWSTHSVGGLSANDFICASQVDALASRIGMEKIKRELEELAFAELNPDGRASVMARLGYLKEQGDKLVPEVEAELIKTLKDGGLTADVSGREKTPYSIWRKMQQKNVSFEQLADIMAFRIIVADVAQCYQALGLLHGRYQVLPQRFKDYISVPKPNGYRSLHTGVIGPLGQRIEIQIRTAEMQDQAERGVAAHWIYKQGGPSTDAPQYAWLRSLMDILDKSPNAEDFLEHTKLEMFQDQVFCFTPKGDLINLPRGSTTVDFAYAVHTEVGHRTMGAKVNGRLVPLDTKLHSGDVVEGFTSKSETASPSQDWLNFVTTARAKSKIRQWISQERRDDAIENGRELLAKAMRKQNLPLQRLMSSDALVRLAAGVGLHVCMLRAKKFFRTLDGERLDHIRVLLAPVVALTGVSLGVLVGENRTCGGHDGGRKRSSAVRWLASTGTRIEAYSGSKSCSGPCSQPVALSLRSRASLRRRHRAEPAKKLTPSCSTKSRPRPRSARTCRGWGT